MKKIFILLLSFFLVFGLTNCSEEDDIPADVEVQNFIWKAMNLYYLWQGEIPDLQDDRFNNQEQLSSFLSGKTPTTVFNDLLYSEDRFSWIVDDYIALENSLAGTSRNNGMEFGLVTIADDVQQIFGYVRYVLPNSDAAMKGVQRGQIIYGINGTQLTRSNFSSLFANDTYTVNFGNYALVGGTPQITSNGNSVSLTKEVFTENPVHTVTINQVDGHTIGYVLYNQFTNEFDMDLNDAFLQLKNANVTDLVLDLRYNGGGSVNTAVLLSSMITGQFTGELFTTLSYNDKLNGALGIQNATFQTQLTTGQALNDLGLTKVYVLVTGSTASASELVINGLKPYIDVELIGTQTVGKAVGSVTLYDSPSYSRTGANPNHTYALQPIISELTNRLGENNKTGFIPDILLPEDYGNLGMLGDVNEPLFAAAIDEITGTRSGIPAIINLRSISNSKPEFHQNNMFIDLK